MSELGKLFSPRLFLAIIIGFLLGILWLMGTRFLLAKNNSVHYHANFAIFVDGKQQKLQGPGYYEEVSACTSNDASDPKARVHLHNNEAEIVHVHDNAATWGDLFNNLGFTLGAKVLALDGKNILIDGNEGQRLVFWLNGQPVQNIAGRTIGNEDVLMVSYGRADDAALSQQYKQIPRSAHQENQEQDPSSCSGSQELTFKQRIIKAFSVNPAPN